MILTGKILSKDEELAFASVYISDKDGNQLSGKSGVSSSFDGTYHLETSKQDYVTASFVGYSSKTILVSEKCKSSTCSYNFNLKQGIELPEVNIVIGKKINWKKIAVISGISLTVLTSGLLLYKKFKK
jgi:hypothetical protein